MRACWLLGLAFLASIATAQSVIFRFDGPLTRYTASTALLGDLDGDGVDDILVGDSGSNGSGSARSGRVDAVSGRTGQIIRTLFGRNLDQQLGALCTGLGDLDDDGVPDFATTSGYPYTSQISFISGRTFYETHQLPLTISRIDGTQDFDRDGYRDLVYTILNGSASSIVCYSPRLRRHIWTAQSNWRLYHERLGYSLATTPDQNNDGIPEVLVGSDYSSRPGGWVEFSGSNGAVLRESGYGYATDIAWVPDLDGDRVVEVAASNSLQNQVLIHFSRSTIRRILPAPSGHTGFGCGIASWVDLDRDGISDLAASSTAPDGKRHLNIISPVTGQVLRSLPDSANCLLSIVDWNRDGFPDLLALVDEFENNITTRSVQILTYRPGSYNLFGTGCVGTFGRLTLSASAAPSIGDPLTIRLDGTAPLEGGVLLIGSSDSAWGQLPLPLPLDFIGMRGCTLYVSGDYPPVTYLPASSTHYVGVPIPDDVTLLGTRFYNQAAQLDFRANLMGLTTSNAARGVVGTQ